MSVQREGVNVRLCMVVRCWEGPDNAPWETFENNFSEFRVHNKQTKLQIANMQKLATAILPYEVSRHTFALSLTWAATSSMTKS